MKKSILLTFSLFTFYLSAQQVEDLNLKGEKARVQQGITSGEITPNETRVIARRAIEYKRTRRQAMKDGVITPIERKRIAIKDAKLDRAIYRKKHN